MHAVGLPVGSEAPAQGCARRQPCRKAKPEQLQLSSTVLRGLAGLAGRNSRRLEVLTRWLQRRKLHIHSWLTAAYHPHFAFPARHLCCRQCGVGRISAACLATPQDKRCWSWEAGVHAIEAHCGLHLPLPPLGGLVLVLLPLLPVPRDGYRVARLEGSALAQLRRVGRRSWPSGGGGSAAVRCPTAPLQLDLEVALPCAARRADVGAEKEEQLRLGC